MSDQRNLDHRDRPVGRDHPGVPVSSTRCRGDRRGAAARGGRTAQTTQAGAAGPAGGPGARHAATRGGAPAPAMSRADALAQSPRVRIDNGAVHGSVSLKGGADRRRDPGRLPRDDRPELARDRAAQPARPPEPLLRRISAGSPADGAAVVPGPGRRCGTAEGGELTATDAVTLTLGQRPGPEPSPSGSSSTSDYMFTIKPTVTNNHRQAGDALPLRPDQPLGHAADARLLHPPRGPDRRRWAASSRSGSTRRSPRKGRSSSTAPAAGSASPTSTGWPRWCRSRTCRSRRASGTEAEGDRYQTDYRGAAHDGGARPDGRDHRPAVRRRQGGDAARPVPRRLRHPAVRPRGRLRLVLLPDQADLLRPALASTAWSAITASPS